MDKSINNNSFEYVDLDLPSRTLWAACNVGASTPLEYGLYFQWGDTKGYKENQVGAKSGQKEFNCSDYKWSLNGSDTNFIKYKTPGAKLELEDDAAHTNMGGDWHIPTPEQIRELLDNTINEFTTLDEINGRLFTSKKDGSKSIFIPAAGGAWGGSVYFSGSGGSIWSSILSAHNVSYGQYILFGPKGVTLSGYGNRYNGRSVRGVIG